MTDNEAVKGLDFTRPATDLIDEVIDRLMADFQERHPGKPLGVHYDEMSERADALVMERLA